MSYLSAFSDISPLQRTIYISEGDQAVGIATDSPSTRLGQGATLINLTANSLRGSTYIFTTGYKSRIQTADMLLIREEFQDSDEPTFGSQLAKPEHSNTIELEYDIAHISGINTLYPGKYSIWVRNLGTRPDGKEEIEITLAR